MIRLCGTVISIIDEKLAIIRLDDGKEVFLPIGCIVLPGHVLEITVEVV